MFQPYANISIAPLPYQKPIVSLSLFGDTYTSECRQHDGKRLFTHHLPYSSVPKRVIIAEHFRSLVGQRHDTLMMECCCFVDWTPGRRADGITRCA